ncbi:hypothetical protein, partial [Enterococcus faecium]|uniref:hypothetical protein n=1 Tax=Enterococcus faecium TaxID=1352 RepID=UPI003F4249AC
NQTIKRTKPTALPNETTDGAGLVSMGKIGATLTATISVHSTTESLVRKRFQAPALASARDQKTAEAV